MPGEFKPSFWEMSGKVAQTKTVKPLSEGTHILRVVDASYDYDTQRYKMKFASFTNPGEESNITYFTTKRDGTDNDFVVGVLNAMAFAVCGNGNTVLAPEDMQGRFIVADVMLGPARDNMYGESVRYPQVEKNIRALTKNELSGVCATLIEAGEETVRDQFYTE